MKRVVSLVTMWSACILSAHAIEPFALKADLSTNRILIGEVAVLKVEVDHPVDARVQLPDFAREKRIIVRDQKATPTTTGGTLYEIGITSLTPGSHLVSTGQVTVFFTNNTSYSKTLPDLTLRVDSALTDTNQALAGLKGPVNWKRPLPWTLMWLIPSLLLLAALITWLVIHLRKLAQEPEPEPPPEPPHEKAMRLIEELRLRQLIEQGKIEQFYVEVSAIARVYLEERFNLRAPEQTTEEFIRSTATSPILSEEHRALTALFLYQCDLVKFARHEPTMTDMRAALAAAEQLVIETKPKPPQPEAKS